MHRVQKWIEDHNYKGYEPFDGLESFLRPLTFGTVLGEQLLQQVGRQSPINIRPLIGVKPQDSTKGRGYIAWGHLHRYAATGKKEHLEKAELCLDWLDHHKSPLYKHHSWGNTFDYASRGGRIPRHFSTVVWTGLIGQAYIEAYEQTRSERWLEITKSLCTWIIELPRLKTDSGDCIGYTMMGAGVIHNSSMLGAAALARAAKHIDNPEYRKAAAAAMEYSCRRQNPDGAWYYGDAPKYHWIDSFHTGYNLDSLRRYIHDTGDERWRENLERGFRYFKAHFIDDDGCPRYYHNRRQPIDIQSLAQVIDTFTLFSDDDPESLELAVKAARWTIRNMQDRDGHFYYRKYPLITAKAPMIHWGQATMFKALAHLASKIEATAAVQSLETHYRR